MSYYNDGADAPESRKRQPGRPPLSKTKIRSSARILHEVGPFFREPPGGLPFFLIDFDKVEVPDWVDPIDDPEGAVEYLVGLLPDYFQDVTYHWQLSSSAGMGEPGVLSAHIWFWLDRDVTGAELTAWGLSLAVAIDVRLFRTVQPHYTAAPIFDGIRDPLPRRSGLRVGLTDAVTLPPIDLPRPKYAPGAPKGSRRTAGDIGHHTPDAVPQEIRATNGDDTRPGAERMAGEATLYELRDQLDLQAVDICEHLYGKPTTQRRHEYRWGRKGSVQLVHRMGRWRWYNWEIGEAGSLFDAIMSSRGLDFVGSVEWARAWLGNDQVKPRTRPPEPTAIDVEQELNCKQAVAIWDAGRPVVGTLANQYLRQHRGIGAAIPHEAARYVEGADIRRCRPKWSWWRWPGALVVAATDDNGSVTGVQLIALTPDGSAARHWASPES